MGNLITKPTEMAMKIMGEYVLEGDTVIDATAGNGNDTLSLAKLVGARGKVYAFDIQESALRNTRNLLEAEGSDTVCELILASHHEMAAHIPEDSRGKIAAAVFNLGYLPSGEKSTTTKHGTTLAAVCQALDLVRKGGLVSITMYGGHPEGALEKEQLLHFAGELPQKNYHVAYIALINQKKQPPELLLITKK